MNRLRELREAKQLSRAKVATDLGISRQGYGYYESGQRTPSVKVLKMLADYFDVTPDYILNEDKIQFDLQMFGNKNVAEANIALAFGQILTLKNERSKELTLQIMNDVIHLDIPKLEALSALIKTIK